VMAGPSDTRLLLAMTSFSSCSFKYTCYFSSVVTAEMLMRALMLQVGRSRRSDMKI